MGDIVDKLKEWWANADQTQKLVSGFGVLFLVLILGFTAFFSTRPKMAPVFAGLSETDKASVYDELIKSGFKVDIQPNGEIAVPIQDVPRAKMALASKNKLPRGSMSGIDIINGIGIGDSRVKENEKVVAAKKQELENSINTMDGIASSQVHLNLGKDSAFFDESTPASASIRITEQVPGGVTIEQGKTIARLVEFAINNLKSADISVVADTGRMVFDGKEESSMSSIANRKIESENAESKRRTVELQSQLDRVFGRGNTIAQVAVNLDMDTTLIDKDETLSGTDPLYVEKTEETLEAAGQSAGGAAGFESNTGAGPAAESQGNDNSNYASAASAVQYPSSQVKTAIQKAAGDIIAMNVTVLANSKSLSENDIQSLNTHVNSYIAPWQGRQEFQASVTSVEFNDETTKLQEKAAADAATAHRVQQLVSLLPVGALFLVAMMLVRSIGKALKGQSMRQMVLSNGQVVSLPANADPELIAMIEQATLPEGQRSLTGGNSPLGLAGIQEDEMEMVEEETGEVDENGEPIVIQRKRKKRAVHDEEDEDDSDYQPVGSIKQKVDVPLEQIKKMAKKNPEAVAMLLKSWVMEERK